MIKTRIWYVSYFNPDCITQKKTSYLKSNIDKVSSDASAAVIILDKIIEEFDNMVEAKKRVDELRTDKQQMIRMSNVDPRRKPS